MLVSSSRCPVGVLAPGELGASASGRSPCTASRPSSLRRLAHRRGSSSSRRWALEVVRRARRVSPGAWSVSRSERSDLCDLAAVGEEGLLEALCGSHLAHQPKGERRVGIRHLLMSSRNRIARSWPIAWGRVQERPHSRVRSRRARTPGGSAQLRAGDAHVGTECEGEAGADGDAADAGDHRLLAVRPGCPSPGGRPVRPWSHDLDSARCSPASGRRQIGAGAEGIPRAGESNHPDVVGVGGRLESLDERLRRGRSRARSSWRDGSTSGSARRRGSLPGARAPGWDRSKARLMRRPGGPVAAARPGPPSARGASGLQLLVSMRPVAPEVSQSL